jgi:hypothetical protein
LDISGGNSYVRWFKKQPPPLAEPVMDDGPPGEADAVARIKQLCWLGGMSAETVALDKSEKLPPEEWNKYEHERYARLRMEAVQLTDSLTDEVYRGAALHFLVELCMKGDDVEIARAFFKHIEIDSIREKIVGTYPQIAHPSL